MDVTWFRPHRHNWTLWEPITGFLGFPAGLQERNCEDCGWTQRADIEKVPTPGLLPLAFAGIPMCEQGLAKPTPTRPNSPKVSERGKPEPMQWIE